MTNDEFLLFPIFVIVVVAIALLAMRRSHKRSQDTSDIVKWSED